MTCRNAVVFLEEIYSLNFILLFQSSFVKQLLLVKISVTSLSPSGSVTGADEAPYRIERVLMFFSKCFFTLRENKRKNVITMLLTFQLLIISTGIS